MRETERERCEKGSETKTEIVCERLAVFVRVCVSGFCWVKVKKKIVLLLFLCASQDKSTWTAAEPLSLSIFLHYLVFFHRNNVFLSFIF